MTKKGTYITRTGLTQYRPSYASLERHVQADQCEGWCLACGTWHDGVEPDARKYTCEECHQPKVYGAEELLCMGLFYTETKGDHDHV